MTVVPLADPSVREVLTAIVGMPCWGVQRSMGSMFYMQFGEPSLSVSSRIIRLPGRSPRRPVHVRGTHYIRVEMARWRILHEGTELASSDSDQDLIDRVLRRDLDGQMLEKWASRGVRTEFSFDLGTSIETREAPDVLARHEDGTLGTLWAAHSPSRSFRVLSDGSVDSGGGGEPLK